VIATTVPDTAQVELVIGGMTCASCAARIEKKLNRMDGVTATVNYATEKAKVHYSGDVSVPELIATVEATGYTAREPEPARTGSEPAPGTEDAGAGAVDELRPLRQRPATALLQSRELTTASPPQRGRGAGHWGRPSLSVTVLSLGGLPL
jgi:Cu+-exporting ATPase